jgi:hypothetical protein
VAKKRVRAESKGAVGAAIAFSLLVMGGLVYMETVGKGQAYELSGERFGRWFTQEDEPEPVVAQPNEWPMWAQLAAERGEVVGPARWVRDDVVEIGGLEFQLLGIEAERGITTCSESDGGKRCGLRARDIGVIAMGPDGLVACPRSPNKVQGRELSHCHVDGRALSVALLRHGLGRGIEVEMRGAGVHESYARSRGLGMWR